MKKRIYALLLGGALAIAGLPLTSSAQTASTGTPHTVTKENPYKENWGSVSTILKKKVWTVEDKNNDGHTWEDMGAGAPAYNGANATVQADDWLVSPPLHLTAGQTYTLEAGAVVGGFSGTGQRMNVAYGTGDDPTTYSEIIATTPISGTAFGTPTTLKTTFTPTATGDYRIGFHAVSDRPGYIIMRPVKVDVTAATSGTPVAITDLTLQAGQNGQQVVKVTFTTPTKDIMGRDLTSLTSAAIYRDGAAMPIHKIDNPAVGQKIEWTDNNVTPGEHSYEVYTYVGDLKSAKAEAKIYVGSEITPGKVKNVTVYDNLDGTITLKWDPVTTGASGGYIDPSTIQYGIFEGIYEQPIIESTTSTEVTIKDIPLNGTQGHKYYQVVAYTDTEHIGAGGFADPFFYGTPYNFPFHESWPYGAWEKGPWSASYNDTKKHFKISRDFSADDDEGSLMFTPEKAGDAATIVGPKMDMGKATNPRLSFQFYAYPGSKSKLQVYLDVNGQHRKLASEIDYATLTGTPGWRTINVDCADADFKKEHGYGRVLIHAISDGENIMVDDVNVNDAINYNVMTTITAPLHTQGGEKAEVTVHVRNVGLKDAEGFQVKLHTSNGTTTATESGTITPGETKEYTFNCPASFENSDFQVWGEADWSADENQENNVSVKKTIKVVIAPYPAINDLKASKDGDKVKLEWTAPAVEKCTITESFETYAPFLTDEIDPWTLYDADKGRTHTFGSISFPGNGLAFAYTVFNCDGTTHGMDDATTQLFKQRFAGHNSDQSMMSFGNLGDAPSGNDDWIISPELSGKAQTITFFTKAPQCDYANYGPEDFYVAYSTSDKNTNSFKKILNESASDNINWKKVSVNLPEGAKYFAIVHTSTIPQTSYGYEPAGLIIDDITYESAPLQILGYNVYRGDKLIASSNSMSEVTAIDPEGTENDKYYVVTMYNVGKSGPSNVASAVPSNINNVDTDATANSPIFVYTTSGILVGNSIAALPAGIYVVKQGNKVHKVVVK